MNKLWFRKRHLALVLINLSALLIAGYLTRLHFKPDLSDVCNFSERWNCDIVNKSTYSTLFGVPVAIFGALTYLSLLIFSIRGLYRDQNRLIPYVFLALNGALAFSLYLTGVEAFILKTFCVFCVAQQVLILLEYGIFLSFIKDLRPKHS